MSPLQPSHQPLPVPQRHQPGHHQGNAKDTEPLLAALTLFGQGGGRAGGGERGCDQHSPKDEAPPGQHPTAAATARRLGSTTPTPWGPRAGAGGVSAGLSAPPSCEGEKQSQGRTGCTPCPQPAPTVPARLRGDALGTAGDALEHPAPTPRPRRGASPCRPLHSPE